MTLVANLLPALHIQRTLPPSQWAAAIAELDEPNKQYLRDQYRRWRDQRRLAHRNDPDTSRQAAERVVASSSRDDHITRVVQAVRRWPGLTSAELSRRIGMERHETARRTADAEHQGRIRKGPARQCSVSGRSAVTWHAPLTAGQQECLWGDVA